MEYITRKNGVVDPLHCQTIRKTIENAICDSTDIATIGLSGGADSTLVAALCSSALGKENVYGYSMPYDSIDTDTFNKRSAKLAGFLGIKHQTISIYSAEHGFTEPFYATDTELSRLNAGNLRSRLRAVYLYTMNQATAELYPRKRCRVVGTGNLSEDYIGYETKGGDSLADIFPIGHLYKQEVYDLLDSLVISGEILDEHIDPVPSAGLWGGQTDEQELGFSYNEMAPAIDFLLNNKHDRLTDFEVDSLQKLSPRKLDTIEFVYLRHKNNKHKHETAPVVSLPYGRN